MNNPFDPAQLGGNMRGIVGSKLFGKSIPRRDTVSQFVYQTQSTSVASREGGGFPTCGSSQVWMSSSFTWNGVVRPAGCYCYWPKRWDNGLGMFVGGDLSLDDSKTKNNCGKSTSPKILTLEEASVQRRRR